MQDQASILESQNQKILKYLKTGRSLTQEEARSLFDCWRLSGRILDLRERGHSIFTEMVKVGRKRFGKYYLIESTSS